MDIVKVGKAIAYLRKQAGYTQKDLAERIGLSDKAVSKWERGLGLPDVSYISKLTAILDTEAELLLAGDVIHHDKGWNGLLILQENNYGVTPTTKVYGKPIVYFLLSYYMLAGIKRIIIIGCKKKIDEVRIQLRDGVLYGIRLEYAENYDCGLKMIDCSNVMVVYENIFLYGTSLTKLFQRGMSDRNKIIVLSIPGRTGKKIYFNDCKKIVENASYSSKIRYRYTQLPIFFAPINMLPSEFDGKSLNLEKAYTTYPDRGFVALNINSWDDVNIVSDLVQIIETSSGDNLYCLEEIAWRRNLIDDDQLLKLAEKTDNSVQRKYAQELLCGFGG